ncbi:hypothetical protein ACFPKZ_00020 [Streptosporangium amethystogenes subsp. fukuiense]|uniref:hypothetical protein n=1 Tax=Streptosporangium amethystogenes TaxID=2002 RepID=UPI00361D2BCF
MREEGNGKGEMRELEKKTQGEKIYKQKGGTVEKRKRINNEEKTRNTVKVRGSNVKRRKKEWGRGKKESRFVKKKEGRRRRRQGGKKVGKVQEKGGERRKRERAGQR